MILSLHNERDMIRKISFIDQLASERCSEGLFYNGVSKLYLFEIFLVL